MIFSGAYTAMVTPFTTCGAVDWERLAEFIEFQIDGGIDGLVPVGTTGESPTLNTDEHLAVIEATVKQVAGRCQVIAGSGANSTAEAIELTAAAKAFGVDATLQVTPYYNKPNERGLIQHFEAVADLGLPVMLYNVPGRAALPISIEVMTELAQHDSIMAVKEAGGSVDRVSQIKSVCDLQILSGDDALTLPMMSVGAAGVVSVASNILPTEVTALVKAANDGNWALARELHYKYYRLFNDMFVETNPIPVKAAMAMRGQLEEVYRLPLCPLADSSRAILTESLKQAGAL